jgi:TetR/AcrR family transcriptional regulator, fatty acid metabolism regulator protein
MDQEITEHQELSDRQRQILESAMKLIAEEGLGEFTTKKLANSVNVSEPALYRHFKNKEAIVFGLIKYLNEKTQEIFDSSDNIKDKSPLEILEIKCVSLIKFFYDNIFCAKTTGNPGMFFPNRDIINESNKLERRVFENEKAIVEKGQREGDIRADLDSEHLVKIVMGSNFFTIHNWIKSETKYDLVSEWMKVWEVIKKMIAVEKR